MLVRITAGPPGDGNSGLMVALWVAGVAFGILSKLIKHNLTIENGVRRRAAILDRREMRVVADGVGPAGRSGPVAGQRGK